MSESTAKAERRALRRAVGPELISLTNDTTEAIKALHQNDCYFETKISDIRDVLAHQLDQQQKQITALQVQLLPLARPWYSRLWWLLTGK